MITTRYSLLVLVVACTDFEAILLPGALRIYPWWYYRRMAFILWMQFHVLTWIVIER